MNLSLSGNDQDWKAALSDDMEHLIEHLISFANHPNGGYLVFGVANTDTALVGVDQEQVEGVIAKLKNLGRDERCRSNFSC